jgi:hypothetical protein
MGFERARRQPFSTRTQHFSTSQYKNSNAYVFHTPFNFPLLSSGDAHAAEGRRRRRRTRGQCRGDFRQQSGRCLGRRSCACPGGALQADKQALTPVCVSGELLRVAEHRSWREGEGERTREKERKRERKRTSERERARGRDHAAPALPAVREGETATLALSGLRGWLPYGSTTGPQRARVWTDARAGSVRSLCYFSKSGMASSASPSYSPQKPMSFMSDANNSMDSFALDDVDATVGIMVWPGKRKRWRRRRAQRRMCACVPERVTRFLKLCSHQQARVASCLSLASWRALRPQIVVCRRRT